MNILLTNDDGISSPGLIALHSEFIKNNNEVTVVAPDSERSAVSHAITLTSPIRAREFYRNEKFFGYAVSGYPADCVKLAYWGLDIKPDIIGFRGAVCNGDRLNGTIDSITIKKLKSLM